MNFVNYKFFDKYYLLFEKISIYYFFGSAGPKYFLINIILIDRRLLTSAQIHSAKKKEKNKLTRNQANVACELKNQAQ